MLPSFPFLLLFLRLSLPCFMNINVTYNNYLSFNIHTCVYKYQHYARQIIPDVRLITQGLKQQRLMNNASETNAKRENEEGR